MTKPLSVEDAVTGLIAVTPRLCGVVVWVILIVVHLTLAVVALSLAWWFQISPLEFRGWASHMLHAVPASTIAGTMTFLGISGGAALWAYGRTWLWLLHKLVNEHLFSGLT